MRFIPLWVRCLPHNLATIRPRFEFDMDWYLWSFGALLYLDSAPGDADYFFHFDEAGLWLDIGPMQLRFLLVDTPGTDCEEELQLRGKL